MHGHLNVKSNSCSRGKPAYIVSALRIKPQRQPDETKQRDKELCFFSIHNPNFRHIKVLQLVTVSILIIPRQTFVTKTTL